MRLLMRNLRTRKTAPTNRRDPNHELSERSIGDYQNTVRKFWRWSKAPPGRVTDATWNPPETAWMKTVTFEKNVLPEDILRPEEKNKMLEVAHHPRDKAYVETSWDSGARPGEILSLRIRDIEFDGYGAVMTIRRDKTGDRRVRLIESVPSLATWINIHPMSMLRSAAFSVLLPTNFSFDWSCRSVPVPDLEFAISFRFSDIQAQLAELRTETVWRLRFNIMTDLASGSQPFSRDV